MVLTTIHSAKGLEFDHVYYFHTHDWYKNYDLETLEEDRRLFYVGISRAKEQLYVFDHTELKRSFEDILRDFDTLPIVETPTAADSDFSLMKENKEEISKIDNSNKDKETDKKHTTEGNVIRVNFNRNR